MGWFSAIVGHLSSAGEFIRCTCSWTGKAAKLNFYEAGGKFGLMAKHGMFEQLTGFSGMPGRAHLHMGYNLFITIPTVLGFLWEFRTISNKYIQMAFSGLSKNDIAKLTQEARISKFGKDDIVFNQGDIADKCYIISRGKVDVIIQGSSGSENVIAQLGVGQIFGEIGILDQDELQKDSNNSCHNSTGVFRNKCRNSKRFSIWFWRTILKKQSHN